MSGHKSNAVTSAASKITETSSAFWRTHLALSSDCSSPSTKHCEKPSRSLMAHSSAKLGQEESNLPHKVLAAAEQFSPGSRHIGSSRSSRVLLLKIDTR